MYQNPVKVPNNRQTITVLCYFPDTKNKIKRRNKKVQVTCIYLPIHILIYIIQTTKKRILHHTKHVRQVHAIQSPNLMIFGQVEKNIYV